MFVCIYKNLFTKDFKNNGNCNLCMTYDLYLIFKKNQFNIDKKKYLKIHNTFVVILNNIDST